MAVSRMQLHDLQNIWLNSAADAPAILAVSKKKRKECWEKIGTFSADTPPQREHIHLRMKRTGVNRKHLFLLYLCAERDRLLPSIWAL